MQLRAMSPLVYSLHQQALEQIEQEFGTVTVPQVFKLLKSQPALLTHLWGQFYALVLHGNLPRVLKEMVGLVVATANHSDPMHRVLMQSLCYSNMPNNRLWWPLPRVTMILRRLAMQRERSCSLQAIAIANETASRALTKSQWQQLHQQTKQALDDTGLEEEEQLELVATIALFEQLCTVANLLPLDSDQA